MKTKYSLVMVLIFFFLSYNLSFTQTLTADAGPDTAICIGQSIQLGGNPVCTGGTAPYSYMWTPPTYLNNSSFPLPIATPNVTTTYTLYVTDASGTTASDAVVVTVNPPPVVNAGSDMTICAGNSTVLNASGGIIYLWSTGQTTPSITVTPSTATTYTVTITDGNGCSGTDDIIVSLTPTADFVMNPDTAVLHHYFVTNNATGYAPLTYLWSWGDGTTDSIAYPSHTYSAAGYYNICLTVTDGMMCTNTKCDSSYLSKSTKTIISVDVIPSVVTNINNSNLSGQISIFPTPTEGDLVIESSQKSTIEILNLNGQIIKTISSFNSKTLVNLTDLRSGVYFVRVKTDKEIITKKIIKE